MFIRCGPVDRNAVLRYVCQCIQCEYFLQCLTSADLPNPASIAVRPGHETIPDSPGVKGPKKGTVSP